MKRSPASREQPTTTQRTDRDVEELGDYLEVEFGTGIVQGVINEGAVTLAGIAIKAHKIGDVFSQSKFSRLLGLALTAS